MITKLKLKIKMKNKATKILQIKVKGSRSKRLHHSQWVGVDIPFLSFDNSNYQKKHKALLWTGTTKNILLNNIKNIINENNINNETQKLIELEIHTYNMKLFNENNNIWKDLSNINKELKDLVINSKGELIRQIYHLKKKKVTF